MPSFPPSQNSDDARERDIVTETNENGDIQNIQQNTDSGELQPATTAEVARQPTRPVSYGLQIVNTVINAGSNHEEQLNILDNILYLNPFRPNDAAEIINAMIRIHRSLPAEIAATLVPPCQRRGVTIQHLRIQVEQQHRDRIAQELQTQAIERRAIENIQNRRRLTLAAPPIHYDDAYDTILGHDYSVNTSGTSFDRYPINQSRDGGSLFSSSRHNGLFRRFGHAYITLTDRSLVETRCARALAGLNTYDMDCEFVLRMTAYPHCWGYAGEYFHARFSTSNSLLLNAVLEEVEDREYDR